MLYGIFKLTVQVSLAVMVFYLIDWVQSSYAQTIRNGSQPVSPIPLTTLQLENVPFTISGPGNFLAFGEESRVFFEIKNTGVSEITGLHIWLMIYYQERTGPVLFERTFSTSMLPGSSKSLNWDVPLEYSGMPVDGLIVPFRIDFSDGTDWNINEYYLANGSRFDEPSVGSGLPPIGPGRPGPIPVLTVKSMDAVQLSGQISLDGVLDEEVWKSAKPATGFLQSEPTEGLAATEITEVYVLHDENNLYIGANLYDSDPGGVLGYQKKRDEGLSSDDRFMWIIDTFLDGRTGYFFETNPAGLLGDGLIGSTGRAGGGGVGIFFGTDGGGGGGGGRGAVNKSWDGVWTVATSIHDKGWTAEVRIPFQTLNFDPAKDAWGINFQRTIRRKNEEVRWSGHKRNQRLTSPVHAGRLNGLQGISQGIGLEIKPYAVLGRQNVPNIIDDGVLLPNPADRTATPSDVGLDISYNITSSLRGAVSVNTDFAEVEVDQRRVNLTRFPLFFQEKRDFFLEGSSSFSFSPRNGVTPYFSRKIGLSEEGQIPILFGARLGGTIGRNEIGIIQVRTDEKLSADVPVEDFSIARIKRSIFQQSSAGLIYTRRASNGINGEPALKDRHTVGTDINLVTSKFLGNKNLEFDGFLVWHNDPERGGTATFNDLSARGLRINYPNDFFAGNVSYRELGEDYDPALGFVTRNGFRRAESRLSINPRPEFISAIRQVKFWHQWRYFWDMSDRLVTKNIKIAFFELIFADGDNLELALNRNFELLDEAFEIHDGITIPVGEYSFDEWEISGWGARQRPVSGQYIFRWGDFWSGKREHYSFSVNVKPFPGINIATTYQYNDVTLPQGDFKTNLYQIEGGLHLTPWSSFASSLQYDDVSEVIGLFAKYRWIVNPGNDFFFVYTQNWKNLGDNVWDFDTKLLSRGATSKINYTHRF